MGLLSYLFGKKKPKLVIDENKHLPLWEEHLTNHKKREILAKQFNKANVDKTLQDTTTTQDILKQLEALISPELIHIKDEKKTEKQLLEDLQNLKTTNQTESIAKTVIDRKQKQAHLIEIFQEIHNVLKSELHLIKLMQRKPSKDLLIQLFRIIFFQEAMLYKVFRSESFFDEELHIHEAITKISRSILLQEKIKEEAETEKEKFAKLLAQKMHQDSKSRYQELGREIFSKLVEMVGAPMKDPDKMLEGMDRLDELVKNEKVMYKLVKKLRPRYDDTKIKLVIIAFREAHRFGFFENEYGEFFT